ncbi:hypothetical protein QTG56_09425 [Rossellomorea sp. AcN35-11]|nr:hypothetical protein [Rossellomorea aquimaris]NMH68473.1 hypothetical protein [Bacillus sp. RO3]WJV31158.1 hypothetical protein QTG56_09425 [Rossellomorea sp. AcN35-11]
MYKDRFMSAVILLLFILLVVHIIRIILHVRIYVVYSMGIGPVFLIGLIIFLIVFLYFKA